MRTPLILAAVCAAVLGGGLLAWRIADDAARSALDAAAAALAERGVTLRWEAAALAGLPLDPHLRLSGVSAARPDGAALAAPWAEARRDVGGVRVDPAQTLSLTPPGGGAAVAVEAQGLTAFLAAGGGGDVIADAAVLRAPSGAELRLVDVVADAAGAHLTAAEAVAETPDAGGLRVTLVRPELTAAEGGGLALTADGAAATAERGAAASAESLALTARDAEGRGLIDLRLTAPQGAAMGIGASAEAAALRLEAPTAAADAPGPYALTLDAEGLTLDAETLTRIDPEAALPREPGALTAALAGEALAPGGGLPPQARTMRLEALRVSGHGAQLEAAGAFERAALGPPDGEITLLATGWAPLAAALAQSGVVPPGTAAMLGLIALRVADPEAPPGVFATRLRLERGAIYANGVRIQ